MTRNHITLKRFAGATSLALALGLGAGIAHAQFAPPPPAYAQGPGGWDAPPPEYRDVRLQGFQDGIRGAQKDFENHRPPNVNNRDEYRHPHVAGRFRHDYRVGFRHGYDVGVQHLTAGGPRPY